MRVRALVVPWLLAFSLLAACSDNDNAVGEQPRVAGPASRYAPALDELPGVFDPLPPETYAVNDEIWARSGLFETPAEGLDWAANNGYAGGWQVVYAPDGLISGVVAAGRYYVTVETYLFQTVDGATKTYDLYEERYAGIAGTKREDIQRVGNQSSGWRFVEGTLPGTTLAAVYHRVVFQRGNMVAIVQTYGAETLMAIDSAREIAILIDGRALKSRSTTEPTAILPRTPTPTGG